MLGFFFKQTMMVFAGVPLVALIWRGRKPERMEVARAMLPVVVMGGVLVGLKIFCPTIYFYMIEVPGSYAVELAAGAAGRLGTASRLAPVHRLAGRMDYQREGIRPRRFRGSSGSRRCSR